MEITKALCLSTSHITAATAQSMEEQDSGFPIAVWRGDYGFFVSVHAISRDGGAGLPGDLIDCMERAVTYDCEFLRLDSDGPVMNGLKTYDW
ncbi:hypothetical protein [Sphingobium sp. MK2]|uniref:DUF5983 family protein n=1 Tax=Sphingobium sp. MK2 TaxID=3116540 RepID=UPI0032E35CBD